MKLVFKQWFFFVLHTIYILLGELFWHKLQIDNKMQMDHIWLCKALSYMGLSHEMHFIIINLEKIIKFIETLALDSRPRQGLIRLRAKMEAWEWRKVWGNEPSHS